MEQISFTNFAEIKIYLSSEPISQSIILPVQQHGDNVVKVITGKEDLNNCDALITDKQGLEMGVRVADCAPICVVGKDKVGIAHVGWRGLCLGLIEKIISQFNQNDIKIYVGPHINIFEIKRDFCYDKIKEKFGTKFFVEYDGKIFFKFTDAILSLLLDDVVVDPRDTSEEASFPSFRRDKTKERFITTIRLK